MRGDPAPASYRIQRFTMTTKTCIIDCVPGPDFANAIALPLTLDHGKTIDALPRKYKEIPRLKSADGLLKIPARRAAAHGK